MFDVFFELPILYYLNCLLLLFGGLHFLKQWRTACGLPALIVLATVFTWYLLDILYNGYSGYVNSFPLNTIDFALFQVLLFTVSFIVFVKPATAIIIGGGNPGKVVFCENEMEDLHRSIHLTAVNSFKWIAIVWLILAGISLIKTDYDFVGLYFPYIDGHIASPWARGRAGSGFDFLLSTAGYIYTLVACLFGVLFVLAESFKFKIISLIFVFLSWPLYLFNRSRSLMLAVVTPSIITYIILSKHSWKSKLAVSLLLIFLINFWMIFVINTRGTGVAQAFKSGYESTEFKHQGLNMFEELCNINEFIFDGSYQINYGKRYFAEAVNWIPRSIWKTKPYIGIDYAIARGQGGGSARNGGVHATVSTGLIGQGVVNFGPIFGPIVSAIIMSAWCGFLGRLCSENVTFFRISLFFLGTSLTFNMGRDISLLVVFPVVFGFFLMIVYESYMGKQSVK